jgi:methionyl-tRNA formyltransferase
MNKRKLVILAGKGTSTAILYNSLKNEYDVAAVILEEPVDRKQFIKKRIRKLGAWHVFGQILFQFSIAKYLQFTSVKRKKEILRKYDLEDTPLPKNKVINIKTINDSRCKDLLKDLKPELVIVNGTRIISKDILNSIPERFINIHAGITPKYRNVHGAYWAIVNDDLENCGVTVHLVDAGIDTGNIIYQQTIKVTKKDNFSTYPILQLAEGIIILKKAIDDIFSNHLQFRKNNLESKMWYHPSFWQYLYYRSVFKKK